MTAVALFDVVAGETAGLPPGQPKEVLAHLAERLIDTALADLRRIEEDERQFGSPTLESPAALNLLRSVYRLFEQWAGDAEQVLIRVRGLISGGHVIPQAEALEDAYARVRARLKLTPEQTAKAMEQVRQGQMVSGEDLRNELRARVRA